MNWRIDKDSDIINMWNIANGFMLASIELATQCLIDNSSKRADILIFPILNNANHSIELYLKGILWTLNKIMNNNLKLEGGHNIRQIFLTVRSRIKNYKGQLSLKSFDSSMENLNLYLEELFSKINSNPKDDKMDFSRYPFNKSYTDHFYITRENVEVDLENFILRFKLIHEKLEEVATFLYDHELWGDN